MHIGLISENPGENRIMWDEITLISRAEEMTSEAP